MSNDLAKEYIEVSIRPPSEDRGKQPDHCDHHITSLVSIRPPSEDRGKLIRPSTCAPPVGGFQSAPHPKTGGNEYRAKAVISSPSFNPPPIRRQGETSGR